MMWIICFLYAVLAISKAQDGSTFELNDPTIQTESSSSMQTEASGKSKGDWFTMYYREPGESIQVYCDGKSAMWYSIPKSQSQIILLDSDELKIDSISSSDFGLFVCITQVDNDLNKRFLFLTSAAYELLDPSWEGDETVNVGQPFQRTCIIRQDVNYTVPAKLTIRRDTSIHSVFVNHGVLRIDSVTYEHEGRYICLLKTSGNVYAARIFHLKPQGPPQLISTRESTKYFKSGETGVLLECPVFGIPVPEFTWSFNGRNSTELPQNPTIELAKVDESSEGIYECTAKNQYGSETGIIELYIVGPPKRTSPVAVEVLNEANKSIVIAECPLLSKMSTHYDWKLKHNGKNETLFPGLNDRLLRAEIIPEMLHGGSLECKAVNKFGEAVADIPIEQPQILRKREVFRREKVKTSEGVTVRESTNNERVGVAREANLIGNEDFGVEPDLLSTI